MTDANERAKILAQIQAIRADLCRMKTLADARRARVAAMVAFDDSMEWLRGLKDRIVDGQSPLSTEE